MSVSGFDDRLARERRARLQAERLLAQRSEELYSANKKLSEHAHALSFQVIEQREENAALVGQSTQAQAALEIATEKADIAERRLWDSLTAVEDGFAIFDSDWRLVTANPAFIAAFDGVADVAPGASYDAILRIAVEEGLVDLEGEDGTAWIKRMISRWEAPKIAQTDLKLWNGAYVRLLDKRTPEGDIVSIAVDITDTIRRQRDLAKARDAAEAAARAKSAFLANMSHEIRTPMNGVVSMADMLRETDLDDEQRLFADTIRNSGEALLVIINDVLDFSKIEAAKLTLHSESFNLETMVHEILRLLRPGLQGKDIDLRLDYDLFLPDRMIGDPGRIRQILTNLIGNAVKFTNEGHVTVHIVGEPRIHPEDRLPLRVVVEDTGIGIAEDMRAHVFGEFNQVEEEANRRHDGTGLGLAITRRLIGMMDGEMWLQSELGKGSAFGFSIVLDRDPAVARDPVAPLPHENRAVHVVTGGPAPPDALRAQLSRLRAEVTHTATLPDTVDQNHPGAVVVVEAQGISDRSESGVVAGPAILVFDPMWDGSSVVENRFGPGCDLTALRRALIAGDAAPVPAAGRLDAPEPGAPDRSPPEEPKAVSPHDVPEPKDDTPRSEPACLHLDPCDPDPGPAPFGVGPMVPATVTAPTGEPGSQPAPDPGPRRLRLLAAEDNKTNQLVFKTMLKTLNLDLQLVENGRLLVEAFAAARPDVIFTDISMPEMDGIAAARSIRAQEDETGQPPVPMVAMTAHAMADDKTRIEAAGINDYLTKPLNKAALFDRIRAHCPDGVDPFPESRAPVTPASPPPRAQAASRP